MNDEGDKSAGKKACKHCGKDADPVHRTPAVGAKPILRGWFCPYCGTFDKVVGREAGLGMDITPQ